MSYIRVIPRDLFNEGKLLKCLGQLALLVHDGQLRSLELVHDDSEESGFVIAQDPDTGGLYCTNIKLLLVGVEIPLRSIYNSKSAYPLVFTDADGGEEFVFDETGKPSIAFLNHIQLTPQI